ncbi:D-alanyl-D-alanine carboxypeptidase [uncultured Pontibacter sp.]|uniref:D-alanyl-D-alanine carboxypeptidase/D-alanyl-D-alanine-endopeptidase n=1 Tax=uncultured Pontibacter sp. TaxID=453356 RepID=UPI00261B20DB|nr:D-alanyl-D-alanine carboxypeptidase [uncultured Pontibacter sp.]
MTLSKLVSGCGVFCYLLLAVACSSRVPAVTAAAESFGPAEVKREVAEAEQRLQSFVGFALYDPELGQMVAEHNADKYFVPASNTKLFTFYASLKMLGDSIPALKYVSWGDSLIFWGTGDPTFTHMDLKNTLAYDFLKNRPEKKLYYVDAPFSSTPFATNWGWDDYNYYYQPERNVFPVHGNIIKFYKEEGQSFTTTPSYFKQNIVVDAAAARGGNAFVRGWRTNKITYRPRYAAAKFSIEVPFITSPEMVVTLLADTLQRDVELLKAAVPQGGKIFYGLPTDTVLKRMLQVSDNLMAEQLLAICSGTLSDTLSVENAIKHVKATYLADLPDEPVWIDGSGLSTMNMFTPRSIIALLQKLMLERPQEELLPMLAVGGRPGTFRNIYKAEVPFVFGKSGTLSHVHNQSGFIITKSGKLLLFSFMNNNFKAPTADIRNEMVRIMTEVHDKY